MRKSTTPASAPAVGAIWVDLAGDRFWMLPERALFMPSSRTLFIADMHCGKAATFRARQIPIPEGGMAADLARLTEALEKTQAQRLVILGDWIHAAVGCTPMVVETMVAWRRTHAALAVTWIKGNHDRVPKAVAAQFACDHATVIDDGPFRFQHDAAGQAGGRFSIGGHEHPVVRLWSPGMPRLTAPCFHATSEKLVLPAFGSFTGGHPVEVESTSRLFLIADGAVVEWSSAERLGRPAMRRRKTASQLTQDGARSEPL